MSQIQAVKDATDILDVIGSRINLNRSGTNWRGLCPFHSEKSPSFFVNDQMQRYRCFGCGESGDVYNFLEKYEGMTFVEALQHLAEKAGIELEQREFTQEDQQRDKLLGMMNLAKEYYHYLLTEHKAGQVARDYLKDRGITQQSIKIFQLGFALDSWDGLYKYLVHKKKYKPAELEAAGLVVPGKKGHYDRFRGRLIFPLTNHRGQVVGFSGRVLDSETKTAKYINSPETDLYHKSELLFGLHELMQPIRKANTVIVAEGEFDVISSAQAHVNNIVAVKGTALTKQHVERLARYVKKIVLALDNDSAGLEATRRAVPIVQAAGLELRVLSLIGGKDVDDLARTDPAKWRSLLDQTQSVFAFFMDVAVSQHDVTTPEGKRQVVTELAPLFAQIPLAVERDYYVKQLAQRLQVKEGALRDDLLKVARSVPTKRSTRAQRSDHNQETSTAVSIPDKGLGRLEAYWLFLLFNYPGEEWATLAKPLVGTHWQITEIGQVIQQLTAESVTSLHQLRSYLDEAVQELVVAVMAEPKFIRSLEASELADEWDQTLKKLKSEQVSQQITAITQQLEALDGKSDKTDEDEQLQAELLQKIVALRAGQRVG